MSTTTSPRATRAAARAAQQQKVEPDVDVTTSDAKGGANAEVHEEVVEEQAHDQSAQEGVMIGDTEGRVLTAEEFAQMAQSGETIQVMDEHGQIMMLTQVLERRTSKNEQMLQEQVQQMMTEQGTVLVAEDTDWSQAVVASGEQIEYEDDFDDDDDAPPPLKMYSTDRLPDFDGVAWALRFAPEEKMNTHWIPVRLPLNLRNASFMIDVTKLADPRDCHVDGYGSWGTPNGQYHLYDVDKVNKTITRLDRGRNMRSEEQRRIIEEFSFKVTRLRYKHPVERNFHKIVYQIATSAGTHKRTLIAYEWHSEPYEVYGLPHGNCRHTAESFQPTLPSQRVRRPISSAPRRDRPRPSASGDSDIKPRPPRSRRRHEQETMLPPMPMPTEFIVYSTDKVPPMQEAAAVLRFSGDEYVNKCWARIKLPLHIRRAAFLVDLQTLENPIDVHIDGYGTWEHPQSYSHFYTCDEQARTLQRIELSTGTRRGERPLPHQYDYRVRQLRYWHPIENRFRKYIFKMTDANDTPMRALVWYDWGTRPYDIGIKTENLTQRAQRYPLFEPAIELTEEEEAQQAMEDAQEAAEQGNIHVNDAPQAVLQRVTTEPVVVITGQGHMYVQPRFPPASGPNEDDVLELNFTTDQVPSFDEVAHELIFGNTENINKHWARVRLANDVKRINFLVDLTALRDPKAVTRDGQGRWGSATAAMRSHYYAQNVDEGTIVRLDTGTDSGRVPRDFAYRVQQARYRHSVDPHLRKVIFTLYDNNGRPLKAQICYSREVNAARDADDEMSMLYWGDDVEESDHSKRASQLRQVVVYHTGPSPAFDEAARILKYGDDSLLNRRWFPVLLPKKCRRACFLVDFFAWKLNQTKDAYGVWAKSSGGTVYYNVDENTQHFTRLNCGRDGRYYIPPKYDCRLVRMRQKHPLEPSFHRWTYCLWTQDGECQKALICYQWLCEPYDLAAVIRGRLAEQGRVFKAPTTPNLYYASGYQDADDDMGEEAYEEHYEDDDIDTEMMSDGRRPQRDIKPKREQQYDIEAEESMDEESMLDMTTLGDAPKQTPRRRSTRTTRASAKAVDVVDDSERDQYDFDENEPINVTDIDQSTRPVTRSGRQVAAKRPYSPTGQTAYNTRGSAQAAQQLPVPTSPQRRLRKSPGVARPTRVQPQAERAPTGRMAVITPREWEQLKKAANAFVESNVVRNFKGDRYTVQDDVYILQVQRVRQAPRSVGGSGSGPTTPGVQYRCLGIPVPGAESLGCSQFVNYRYICPHTLAVAQHCGEREAFINFVKVATGAQPDEEEEKEDAFERAMPDEMLVENEGAQQGQIVEQEQYEYVDKELPPQLQPQHRRVVPITRASGATVIEETPDAIVDDMVVLQPMQTDANDVSSVVVQEEVEVTTAPPLTKRGRRQRPARPEEMLNGQ